jgi:hypothetical protein
MELGGPAAGTQYDQIHVTDLVDLDGMLEVILIDDFTPSAGDVFDLLDSGSLTGSFAALDLPDLSSEGLFWDTSSLLVDGTLVVVVPEPAGLAVVTCILAVVSRRGRRRRMA